MRATYSASTLGMHHMSFCQGLRWFSAKRRRTVSRDRLSWSVSGIIASACGEQNLGSFDLAGVMLAAAHQRGEFTPLGFAQFDMVAYVHSGLLANRDVQTNLAMNRLLGACPRRLPPSPTSKVDT